MRLQERSACDHWGTVKLRPAPGSFLVPHLRCDGAEEEEEEQVVVTVLLRQEAAEQRRVGGRRLVLLQGAQHVPARLIDQRLGKGRGGTHMRDGVKAARGPVGAQRGDGGVSRGASSSSRQEW